MKHLLFIILVLVVISCGQQTSNSEIKETAKENIDTTKLVLTEFDITGMTCTGCENTINGCVEKLNGIGSITSDHIKGIALVKYDSTLIKPENIVEAINNTGYTAKIKETN